MGKRKEVSLTKLCLLFFSAKKDLPFRFPVVLSLFLTGEVYVQPESFTMAMHAHTYLPISTNTSRPQDPHQKEKVYFLLFFFLGEFLFPLHNTVPIYSLLSNR